MRGKVHILVNCPITTFLKEKQHSAMWPLRERIVIHMINIRYIMTNLQKNYFRTLHGDCKGIQKHQSGKQMYYILNVICLTQMLYTLF